MRLSTIEKIEEQESLTKEITNYVCYSKTAKNNIRFTNGCFVLTDDIIFEKRNCVIKKWMIKWKVTPTYQLNFERLRCLEL